jgi:hypothetical protein
MGATCAGAGGVSADALRALISPGFRPNPQDLDRAGRGDGGMGVGSRGRGGCGGDWDGCVESGV